MIAAADASRPADPGARVGARQRRPLARAAAMPGCTATSSTTARSSRAKSHYFHCAVALPASSCRRARRRFRCRAASGRSTCTIEREFAAGEPTELPIRLEDNDLPPEFGKFLSADLHVHMNYGGHYRSTPETLLAQQDAEDLDVVYNLLVNKEERIPDIGYFRPGGGADPASGKRLLFHAQEYHTSFWGHMGLLNLEDHFLLPDYAAYRHTALASPWPNNGAISDLAHAQGALVGYVHIADFPIDPPKEKVLSYELPADVAHGKVDYLEVMGFSDHHITAGIWYRLLNLGFRLPAGAGTDAMANYASLRGPIGLVRVFLETDGERTPKALLDALKSGPHVRQQRPAARPRGRRQAAGRFARARAGTPPVRVAMRAPFAVDHLELVQNGRVIKSFELTGERTRFDWSGDVAFEGGGWLVLRAYNDQPNPWVLDLYPYATTSPIYFESPPPPAPEDAAYFVAWMDRVVEAAARTRRLEQRDRESRHARLPGAREGEIPRARQDHRPRTDHDTDARIHRPAGRRRTLAFRGRGRAHEVHGRRPGAHRQRHRTSTSRRTASTSSTAWASRTSRKTRRTTTSGARAGTAATSAH